MRLVLFYLFFFSISTFAQKGATAEGYIINNDGEKIEGYVKVQKSVENMVKVKFSETKKAKKFPTFKTKDLLGYGFTETRKTNMNKEYIHWRHFKKFELDRPAKVFASSDSFLEKIIEGPLVCLLYTSPSPRDS